jgi:cytochrome c-type biogenesis protein CcmH
LYAWLGQPAALDEAEYAEVLATAANGHFEGKPLAMVERALSLAPDMPLALALAATAAFNRGDMAQAALYWERLLKQLPPESDDAKWVVDQLARTQRAAHATSGAARTTRP